MDWDGESREAVFPGIEEIGRVIEAYKNKRAAVQTAGNLSF